MAVGSAASREIAGSAGPGMAVAWPRSSASRYASTGAKAWRPDLAGSSRPAHDPERFGLERDTLRLMWSPGDSVRVDGGHSGWIFCVFNRL
jgi:hypothetical protein